MATRSNIKEIPTALSMAYRGQRCLHALSGRAPEHKVCSANYECGSCPFDQMLDDMNHVNQVVSQGGHSVAPAA
jgi:hypothetical protein